MKNLKFVFLTVLSFLMLSITNLSAAPSTELTAESCGGYVIVYNHSDCLQTVYCHEISTDNFIYNMGTIQPGGSVTVYPTASQARVYSETPTGWESNSVMADCVQDYTVTIQLCSQYTCDIDIVNNGCQVLEVYAAVNGEWAIVKHVAVGATVEYHPQSGETLIFAYSYDDILGTVTAQCGKTYTINDDDCAQDCIMHLTNNACHDLKMFIQNGSDWTYVGLLIKGQTYDHHSANGVTYKFMYADGTVVGTWTGWCGESYTATDQCSTGCQIYLKNEACAVVKVYVEYRNDWTLVGSLNEGVTYSHHSTNGARYKFRYADGTDIATWTGWCGESYTITDQCNTTCDVYFDNDACDDILVYAEDGSDWNYVGTLDKGVKYRHTATQGVTYRFKYADGTQVAQWDAWCGETFVINDVCSSCNIYFKNKSCATIKVYQQNGYDWSYIGSLDKDRTYTHASQNGATYQFKYADGTTVSTWTGWCGESYEITDDCHTPCHVTIKNRTCGTVQILKNHNGVLVSKGYVEVGESKVLYDYEGSNYIIKNADGSHAGSWTSVCDNAYTVHEDCPTECDAYIKNEACGPLTVYKVQSGYNTVSMGTVQVGSNLKLEAEEGTRFIMKYADGSVVGEWDLVCNTHHVVGDTCGSPCDGVSITSIKIYDQETDLEVPGIGALSEGMVIDGDVLPAGYYITAEVSSATESVSLVVDGWLVCENYAPYTYPNAAHQGTDWDGGAGAHAVTVKVSSEADCYGDSCDELTVNFTITEGTPTTPTCGLDIAVSQSAPGCDGLITLGATVTGASSCCDGGGAAAICGTLATYGGYTIDIDAVSGCADDAGIRLWRAGAQDETFVTVDLGSTVAAGHEVCIRMFMKHCLNTDSTSASASIYTSLSQDTDFTSLSGAIFDNAEFQDFCFDLTTDSRYIKIVDNGQCSFRVDAVTVSGTESDCAENNDISYYWLNSTGDTISTSASVAVNQTGDYMIAVKDCAGCLEVVEDIQVTDLEADDCVNNVSGGFLALENGETVIDVCIGDGVSDAFNVTLGEQNGEFSAWVILDAFRNIISIPSGPPFDFETSTSDGLCIICHVSYNGTLTGFEVGQHADAVTGDVNFSNEISVTKFSSGGPCGNGGLLNENSDILAESRSFDDAAVAEVAIYPNPVRDILFITANVGELSNAVEAQIFSIDGKLVKESQLMTNQINSIDISDLQSQQFYIVKINNAELGVHVERIYKSK